MAKNAVADWSTTAASNTDIAGVNISEGCQPSGINDAIRAIMAQIATFLSTAATTAATALDLFTPTSTSKAATPKALQDAVLPTAIAYAATITLDGATGIDFAIGTLTGNVSLANPTNIPIGRRGRIRLQQDATGGRVISYGTQWKREGGPRSLSPGANAVDFLYYDRADASTIIYDLVRNPS